MAKFTWTVESDDVKEAIRINEEMAAMMYRVHKKEKAPVRKPGGGAEIADKHFEIVNPAAEQKTTFLRDAKGVREATDQMIAWVALANAQGDLKQLVTENAVVIRTLMNERQRGRFARHVSEREAKIATDERMRAAPQTVSVVDGPKPTPDQMATEFRALFDVGGEKACAEVLGAFRVTTLKDLPENLWPDALVSIRSAIVVHATTGTP